MTLSSSQWGPRMGAITYGLVPRTPWASSHGRHLTYCLAFVLFHGSLTRRFYCHFLSRSSNHLLKVRVANAGQGPNPCLPDVTALGMITPHWGHCEALSVKWVIYLQALKICRVKKKKHYYFKPLAHESLLGGQELWGSAVCLRLSAYWSVGLKEMMACPIVYLLVLMSI